MQQHSTVGAVLDADACDDLFAHLERSPVLAEVIAERRRQEERWGEQNHPLTDPAVARPRGRAPWWCGYELPSAERARFLCELAAERGELTWAHILVEEVAEFVAADNPVASRAELVQVAAVAVAAIEGLDRSQPGGVHR